MQDIARSVTALYLFSTHQEEVWVIQQDYLLPGATSEEILGIFSQEFFGNDLILSYYNFFYTTPVLHGI